MIWEDSIYDRIDQSDFVILILSSKSVEKTGFSQKEIRIFFRLTQRPTNSLIPLRDLIDDPTDNTRYSFYRSLLAHLAQKTEFPFPYYPSSAVFERQEDTLQQVVVIENVKAVLSGTCPHCNGNFQQQQVEAYTNGETITCEYCQYSLKAEWRSMR